MGHSVKRGRGAVGEVDGGLVGPSTTPATGPRPPGWRSTCAGP